MARCVDFGPRELRVLGRRILDVVAPEVAEEHERRALAREEQRARRRMRVTTRPLGDGLTRIIADLPTLHADLLATQLHAYASPRRDHLERSGTTEGADRYDPDIGASVVSYPRLLAQAFCALLERLPRTASPDHGGNAATLVVTVDHDKLAHDLGVARLSTGHAISVGEARRLACTAGILPMVLNGASQPLDVGRRKRFHTPAMRHALAVRDRECRAVGCEIPAAWCEAHHVRPWAAGARPDQRGGWAAPVLVPPPPGPRPALRHRSTARRWRPVPPTTVTPRRRRETRGSGCDDGHVEDPHELLRRLKLGREEYCQRLLTMLVLDADYPRWNTRNTPSPAGLTFLRALDELSFGAAEVPDPPTSWTSWTCRGGTRTSRGARRTTAC